MRLAATLARAAFVLTIVAAQAVAQDPNTELMKKLYTKIGQAVGVGANDPSTAEGFLVLTNPGVLLDPTLNYNTPAGRFQFAQTVDRVLQPSWIYAAKSANVMDVYKAILDNHEVPAIAPTKAQKDAYKAACRKIYTDCDHAALPSATSPAYEKYMSAMRASIILNKQAEDYRRTHQTEELPPDLAADLFEATNRLANVTNATQIESALATMASYDHIDPNAFWGELRTRFDNKTETFNAAPFGKLDVSPAYSVWLDPNRTWSKLELKQTDLEQSTSLSQTSISAGGGFSIGLFSIGGDYSHLEQRTSSSLNGSNYVVGMELMRVAISRPWMNSGVFDSQAWKWLPATPFDNKMISSGVDAMSGQTPPATDIMPFLPTGLLIARKVTLTANWNADLATTFNSETSSGGSFSWGPFSLGGRYRSSDANTYHKASAAGNTLTFDDPQIIGYFVQVLPKSPAWDPCYRFPSAPNPPAYCSNAAGVFADLSNLALIGGPSVTGGPVTRAMVLNSAQRKLRAARTFRASIH